MRSVIIGRKSPFPSVAARESCAGRRPRWKRVGSPWIPQPATGRVVRAEQLSGTDEESEPGELFAWSGKTRSARPAKRVCASSVSPAFGGPAETKKARHRRCFKSPVQTLGRPQARANLGKRRCMRFALRTQGKSKRGGEACAKKEGAARAAPPIAPRSDEVRFWFNPRAPKLSVASRMFLPQGGFRVPAISLSANQFPNLCPSGNTVSQEPRSGA